MRPTMEDFFKNAAQCKNEMSSCSKKAYTAKKIQSGKDISATEYGFGKGGGSHIASNYFCLVEYSHIDYPAIYLNDTSSIANVFIQ